MDEKRRPGRRKLDTCGAAALRPRPLDRRRPLSQGLTCREFVEFLADYLAGALPPAQRDAFDGHLALCPSCVAYLNTYRQAIRLGHEALRPADDELGEQDAPEELVRAVLEARRSR